MDLWRFPDPPSRSPGLPRGIGIPHRERRFTRCENSCTVRLHGATVVRFRHALIWRGVTKTVSPGVRPRGGRCSSGARRFSRCSRVGRSPHCCRSLPAVPRGNPTRGSRTSPSGAGSWYSWDLFYGELSLVLYSPRRIFLRCHPRLSARRRPSSGNAADHPVGAVSSRVFSDSRAEDPASLLRLLLKPALPPVTAQPHPERALLRMREQRARVELVRVGAAPRAALSRRRVELLHVFSSFLRSLSSTRRERSRSSSAGVRFA